jgi:hypothetical protein
MSFAGHHPDINPAYLAPDDWRGTVRSNAVRLAAAEIETLPCDDVGLEQPSMEAAEPESQYVDANTQVRSEIEPSHSFEFADIGSTHRVDPIDDRRPQNLKNPKPTYIKNVVDASGSNTLRPYRLRRFNFEINFGTPT